MEFSVGDRYADSQRVGRVIELVERVDPQGPVGAYWRVRNVATGHPSLVAESNIGERYTPLTEPTG